MSDISIEATPGVAESPDNRANGNGHKGGKRKVRAEASAIVLEREPTGGMPWDAPKGSIYVAEANQPRPTQGFWGYTAPRHPGDRNTDQNRLRAVILWAAPAWELLSGRKVPPSKQAAMAMAARRERGEVDPNRVVFMFGSWRLPNILPHSLLLGLTAEAHFSRVWVISDMEVEAMRHRMEEALEETVANLEALGYTTIPSDIGEAGDIRDRTLRHMIELLRASGRTDLIQELTGEEPAPRATEGGVFLSDLELETAPDGATSRDEVRRALGFLGTKGLTTAPKGLMEHLAVTQPELLAQFKVKVAPAALPAPQASVALEQPGAQVVVEEPGSGTTPGLSALERARLLARQGGGE